MAKAKQKAKRGSQASQALLEGAEAAELLTAAASDGTPKTWLHDLVQCVEAPRKFLLTSGQPIPPDFDAVLNTSTRKAFRTGFTFCWAKEVNINGKPLKTWSAARKGIKAQIVQTHQHLLVTACGFENLDKLPADDLADKLIQLLDRCDDGAARNVPKFIGKEGIFKELEEFLTCERVMDLLAWQETNLLSLAPDFSSGYQDMMRRGMVLLGDVTNQFSEKREFKIVQGVILPLVYDNSSSDLVTAARLVLKAASEDPTLDVNTLSHGVFETVNVVEKAVASRPLWNAEVLRGLAVDESRVTTHDHGLLVEAIKAASSSLAVADALQTTKESWLQFWQSICALHQPGLTLKQLEEAILQFCVCSQVSASTDPGIGLRKQESEPQAHNAPASLSVPIGGAEAGGTGTAAAAIKFTPVTRLRLSYKVNGSEIPGNLMFVFTTRLQAFIVETIHQGVGLAASQNAKAHRPDAKLATVGDIEGEQGLYSQVPIDSQLVLNFHGHIVRVPSKGCLPICTFMGMQFFMAPNVHALNLDSSCPAWSAAAIKPGGKRPITPHLICHIEKHDMDFNWKNFLNIHKETVRHSS